MGKKSNVNLSEPEFEMMAFTPTEDKEVIAEKPSVNYNNVGIASCLQNRRVVVKYINKPTSLVRDPKHPLYGGMAQNATKTFSVPLLRNGQLKNPLTKEEKTFLEYEMGLESNALSIHKRDNNFWENGTINGISNVTLYKQDNYFDLSNPADYIRYKILLANSDFIAPSLEEYQATKKETYCFYIVNEGDEDKAAVENTDDTMESYQWLATHQNDTYTLRVVVETLSGKVTSNNTSNSWLKTECGKFITQTPKKFIKVVKDKLLDNKILIRKSLEAGFLINRDGMYSLSENGKPLCEADEQATIDVAAAFLDKPKNQGIKFMLQEKLKL